MGTRLVTAYDQPALGGVYKLGAVRPRRPDPAAGGDDSEGWEYRVKLSEQAIKVSTPGVLQVRRYRRPVPAAEGGLYAEDMIYDTLRGIGTPATLVDPLDPTCQRTPDLAAAYDDLLVPVIRGGKRVYDPPPLAETRGRVQEGLAGFHTGVKRFWNPHRYPVGLELGLHELKTRLIRRARGQR